jgi:hypothetical protein
VHHHDRLDQPGHPGGRRPGIADHRLDRVERGRRGDQRCRASGSRINTIIPQLSPGRTPLESRS